MTNSTESDPHVILRAQKVGKIVGVLVLLGAITFSLLFRDLLPSPLYWLLFVSGTLLAIALPSWLMGRYAKRQFERAQALAED